MPDVYGRMLGGLLLLALAYVVVGLCCSMPRLSGLPRPPRWVYALHTLIGETALLTILIGAVVLWNDPAARLHRGINVVLIVLPALFLAIGRVARGGRLT